MLDFWLIKLLNIWVVKKRRTWEITEVEQVKIIRPLVLLVRVVWKWKRESGQSDGFKQEILNFYVTFDDELHNF